MNNPEVFVIKTDGINCDVETAHAFSEAGAKTSIVHINQIRSGERSLSEAQVMAFAGGFSHGDDISSGRVLATEVTETLGEQVERFTEKGKPIIGICNGFQVLAKAGLLPNKQLGEQSVTLADNNSGIFGCVWTDLRVGKSACKFIGDDQTGLLVPMQVAHAEGRFTADESVVDHLERNGQVVFRYADGQNPNGSDADIAGICDESGTILGLMPHPERSIQSLHPDRRRTAEARQFAQGLFRNIVNYAREL